MASEIKANKISPATGTAFTIGDSGDTFTVPSGATLAVASGATISNAGTQSGFGKVLQVVSATKTDTFSTASATLVDVTGLSVSITPSSTSSKILVTGSVNGAGVSGSARLQSALVRNSTLLLVGDSAGSRGQSSFELYADESGFVGNAAVNYLDSPSSTSSLTYKIQIRNGNSNASSVYVNRTQGDNNTAATNRYASSITVMEIEG